MKTTNLFLLAGRRVLAAVFPSVPRADRDLIATAMQSPYPTAPATGSCGEAGLVAGPDPVDGVAPAAPAPSTGTTSARVAIDMPRVEDLRNWRAHPSRRGEFTDPAMAAMLEAWS